MASLIFSCWAVISSDPLVRSSGVASLTLLDVPHDNVCGGRGSSQLTHILCSASHGSCVCERAPQLCALVAIGLSPWQLPHVPQWGALHGSHAPHRSKAVCSCRVWGRLSPGMKGLCPWSSMSFFLSLLSVFVILLNSLHLTSLEYGSVFRKHNVSKKNTDNALYHRRLQTLHCIIVY